MTHAPFPPVFDKKLCLADFFGHLLVTLSKHHIQLHPEQTNKNGGTGLNVGICDKK